MKIKYLLFVGLMCICGNSYAQLTIPKKKCTRGKCYFVDQTGKRISDYYEKVEVFKEELAPVKNNGKWGFLDQEMEMAIPLQFQEVSNFKDGLAYVKKADQYYLINSHGKDIGEKYDWLGYHGHYYIMKKGSKFGLLDTSGKVIEAPKFDKITAFHKNDFGVLKDGKWANYNNGNLNYNNPDLYFNEPEEMPVFSSSCMNTEDLEERNLCSDKALIAKVYKSLRYPAEARKNGIQGTVILQLLINKEGALENLEIIKNVGSGCGEEALNVVKTYLRKWARPGMENGMPVNTLFQLPIKFKLE